MRVAHAASCWWRLREIDSTGPVFNAFANSPVDSATIATSTFYSVQMIFNGASSEVCVNNSCGSMANAGTGGIGARFYLGQNGYGAILGSGGYIVEAIFYTYRPRENPRCWIGRRRGFRRHEAACG
jgi:hypothetical protein